MVRLVFPRHLSALIGHVQYALLQAKEQGFAIQHIRLDVGSEAQFILEKSEESLRIGSSLCSQEEGFEPCDYYLDYVSENRVLPEAMMCNARCTVTVGLHDEYGFTLDKWQYGHAAEQLIIYPSENHRLNSKKNQHLAWVLATLALGFPIEDGLCIARAAITQGDSVSRETWPTQFERFPAVQSNIRSLSTSTKVFPTTRAFPRIDKAKFNLYPVVDDVNWIEHLLKLGVRTVQLRIKDLMQGDLEAQIIRAITLGREFNAQVFINDYWQLAIKHQAYGVHLGQEDLTSANLTELLDAGIRLGLSTHGYYELLIAAGIQPSYIALGHIFPTTTKQMPSKPQGLARLAAYQRLVNQMPYQGKNGIPTVAIGGIDLSNIRDVLDCGVTAVAVVRAITESPDPSLAVQALSSAFADFVDAEYKLMPASESFEPIGFLAREVADAHR
ncbi:MULTISPECIES: thiamine phosphate synthase [Vibrio]|uniref:thiamine phosphate synthase n=1 Tax=Vibrio TaxID=662 RepID=UPI00021A9CAE|nr:MULTISPECIES: thiamine phosphate synthase [Vibrio]EGS64012.1 thiamine-phosphate pyrophosphorylase [Vibrio paracholerae HE-09]EKA3901646.1 thiamine phosphate synthase [Vibrio cholerae]KFD80542.1 thiamine-phosphate pyrophosphorylase [Vibrio paracholerae]MBW5419506.1 thiamine phosphate synthase [Vibrio cholerae]MDP4495602.1 thiamine phosphate synthase [Vibrio cholerae]